jgi:glycosyltransferase involved in cell wall biosynthesis
MKKVLIFSLAYYPHVGGAEIAIREITKRISDIEFHLITQRFNESDLPLEKIDNVTVHRIGSGSDYLAKILFIPSAAARALALHAEHKFDALWAMMSYMLLPIVLMRFQGVELPYALSLQEGDSYGHMFGRMRILPFVPLLNLGFRSATIVQTISNYLATWARARGYKKDIEVIPNGVDVAHFSGGKKPHDGKILITASRLVPKNAIDDVIRALPEVSDVKFKVLGTGKERERLEKIADENNVSDRVEFLGHVDHKNLPEQLHGADIFIRPSRTEGMGSAFVEAMAAELPVIATQEGGIADFLFDEKRNSDKPTTGWAVDKDSPEQIAAAIKDILARPEKVSEVTSNAKRMVLEKYDWYTIAKSMREKVFEKLFT